MRATSLFVVTILVGCGKSPDPDSTGTVPVGTTTTDTATSSTSTVPLPAEVTVSVTLDGTAVEGALVSQGGGVLQVATDATGRAVLPVDPSIPGEVRAIAQHPDARSLSALITGPEAAIDLESFDRSDNPAYVFQDPGTPDDRGDTSKCAHCHQTISEDWVGSAHRQAASNPHVHDVYAGTAAIATEGECLTAGGQWWEGLEPGTGAAMDRCYLGAGTLPDLNPGCGDTGPCDGVASATGACADCHAPGIDGVLGGRDLLEARGHAYEYGVHCDVCHKVEAIDLSAPPGVGGRLQILRPTEARVGFDFAPLTFGPYGDVVNPRMGAAGARGHFTDTGICAGCHQLDQAVLVPGASVDTARWPTGVLPVHSTWREWFAGPMNPGAPCQSCHLPPDPVAGNSADLYNIIDPDAAGGIGIGSGWPRAPGAVRRHLWSGPRQDGGADVLALAASVDLAERMEATELVVDATVTNIAAGHGIPTGEPARNLLLVVEVQCDGAPLVPTGGDVLPDYAGALDRRTVGIDDDRWPGAAVGDRIRVVHPTGVYRDYPGFGPFGDGTFDAAAKGVEEELWVGEATITAVAGDQVTLDGVIPSQVGDIAYRVPAAALPVDGAPIGPLAGAPGYGFARVLVDAAGNRMVPHHAAVDVVSDHRLLPQQAWTSTHRFDASGCTGDPEVRAVLVHRAFPYAQAAERAWSVTESVMVEAVR